MLNRSISRQNISLSRIAPTKTSGRQLGRCLGKIVLAGMLIAPLASCEQSMNISDEELIERISECLGDNLTPGMAVACGNYQKECQRRGKKTGNYIC